MRGCAEVKRKDGAGTYLPSKRMRDFIMSKLWVPKRRGRPLKKCLAQWTGEKGATQWSCAEVDRRDGVITNPPKIKTPNEGRRAHQPTKIIVTNIKHLQTKGRVGAKRCIVISHSANGGYSNPKVERAECQSPSHEELPCEGEPLNVPCDLAGLGLATFG